MRSLRVVGLDEDGETVVCEDPENGDRFSVPADERLRAAARGDLTRLGQVQIELEAQLRPREIQARVRAGASVQQIATAAGIPEQRVERYAYPVLLERAQIAEMAQRAHPIREDGPDVQALAEVVAHTFGMRGFDYSESTWDSWRGDDNKWVVRLHWTAGRSDNSAHWVFHPGAHGGTVAPLDEHAADLLDPSPTRALRTVRPVTELAREALELDQTNPAEEAPPAAETPEPEMSEPSEMTPAAPQRKTTPSIPALEIDPVTPKDSKPTESRGAPAEPAAQPEQQPEEYVDEAADADEQQDDPQRRARKNHPIVPSWEDVLLGVRSHR